MKRTLSQNAALHVYLSNIAIQLSEAGLDMRQVVKLPIKPTMENVKEELWHPVMTAMFPDIESSAKLSTTQMQEVYEVFNSAMGERLGCSDVWPSLDEQLNESRVK